MKYPPYPSWSPDSRSLVIQTADSTLKILDTQTGKTLATYQSSGANDYISTFAFGIDKNELLILNEFDSNLYTWNVPVNQITRKKISNFNDCLAYSIRVNNNGIAYFCSGYNGEYDTLHLISDPITSAQQNGYQDSILDYEWQPNSSSITVLYYKGMLQTWDTQTDKVESYQLFISPSQISWSVQIINISQ